MFGHFMLLHFTVLSLIMVMRPPCVQRCPERAGCSTPVRPHSGADKRFVRTVVEDMVGEVETAG